MASFIFEFSVVCELVYEINIKEETRRCLAAGTQGKKKTLTIRVLGFTPSSPAGSTIKNKV